jgi:hypothetical protein
VVIQTRPSRKKFPMLARQSRPTALPGADLCVARHFIAGMRRATVPVTVADLSLAAGCYNVFGGQILPIAAGEGFLELDGAGLDGRFVPLATDRTSRLPGAGTRAPVRMPIQAPGGDGVVNS